MAHPLGNVTVMVGRPEFAEPFALSWQHNCAAATTQFTLVARATGWLAFGLCDRAQRPDDDAMVGCEFFMFNAEGGVRNGGNVSANGEPKPLAASMIRNDSLVVTVVESLFNVTFARAWLPLDATHAALDAPDGLRLMASRGPTPFFGVQHFGSDRAQHPSNIFLFGAPASSNATTTPASLPVTSAPAPSDTSDATTTTTTILHSTSGRQQFLLQIVIILLMVIH